MEHAWMAVSRDTYPNFAINLVLMERTGQIAVWIVETVVTWDNVIILMERARMVARSVTMVQNARKNAPMVCLETDV